MDEVVVEAAVSDRLHIEVCEQLHRPGQERLLGMPRALTVLVVKDVPC